MAKKSKRYLAQLEKAEAAGAVNVAGGRGGGPRPRGPAGWEQNRTPPPAPRIYFQAKQSKHALTRYRRQREVTNRDCTENARRIENVAKPISNTHLTQTTILLV